MSKRPTHQSRAPHRDPRKRGVERRPSVYRPPGVSEAELGRTEAMRGLNFGQRVVAGRIKNIEDLRSHCDRVRSGE